PPRCSARIYLSVPRFRTSPGDHQPSVAPAPRDSACWQELLPTAREEARKAGPGSRLMRTFWGKLSLFNCHLSFADGNRRLLLEEPLAIMQFVRHGGHYFAHLAAGDQLECVLRLPGMGISDGVFKSEINLQRPGIDTPNPFDDTKFLTVGMTDA